MPRKKGRLSRWLERAAIAEVGHRRPAVRVSQARVLGSAPQSREMIRAGAVLDAVGIVLSWVALRVLCPLFGLVR